MISRKIKLIAILGGILLMGIAVRQTVATHSNDDTQSNIRAITVKIWAEKEAIGSGVIWQTDQKRWRVVTNQHVIAAGKKSFVIQTADGKAYYAKLITPRSWAKLDLAALEFQPDLAYPTAKIDRLRQPQVGDAVVAAGFPRSTNGQSTALTIAKGTITHVLSKPLAEGYQVGYSNNVAKGMSGGPLLNQRGELVGINGIHSQPLWEAGEFYDDGTTVAEPLLSEIGQASWAIPVARLALAP
jgi:serine protease Do